MTRVVVPRSVLLIALASASSPSVQQVAPSTDIFVAPLVVRGDRVEVGTPVNVTRRFGYDNQPAFSPDGRRLYYTSVRDSAPAPSQADIWQYDFASQRSTRVTATSESEYSATPTPDGHAISVVRVERDSTQRLWRFPLDASGAVSGAPT